MNKLLHTDVARPATIMLAMEAEARSSLRNKDKDKDELAHRASIRTALKQVLVTGEACLRYIDRGKYE